MAMLNNQRVNTNDPLAIKYGNVKVHRWIIFPSLHGSVTRATEAASFHDDFDPTAPGPMDETVWDVLHLSRKTMLPDFKVSRMSHTCYRK